MAQKHSVYDNDTHFSVIPNTRALQNESFGKSTLIQRDHNSERFTFEIPRYIEGHDMSLCDTVQVHYNNIDFQTKAESKGVYLVDDMQISPDDDNIVICSWLISQNATQFVGTLNFLLRFSCFQPDGTLSYVWNTAIYTKISISDGIYNGEVVAEEYADILNAWETELKANQIVSLEQTQEADGDEGVNVWEATFGDGRKSQFNVRNGSRGPTGYIGSIETITGDPLHFFVGTQEEYNKLTDKQKDNLFAIISDDPARQNILNSIAALQNEIKGLKSGSVSISYAQTAGHALTATRADNAGHANTAGEAAYAQQANKATTADRAEVAARVEDGGGLSVQHAVTAGTAEEAEFAKGDQKSISETYFKNRDVINGKAGTLTLTKKGYYLLQIVTDDGDFFDFGLLHWWPGDKVFKSVGKQVEGLAFGDGMLTYFLEIDGSGVCRVFIYAQEKRTEVNYHLFGYHLLESDYQQGE